MLSSPWGETQLEESRCHPRQVRATPGHTRGQEPVSDPDHMHFYIQLVQQLLLPRTLTQSTHTDQAVHHHLSHHEIMAMSQKQHQFTDCNHLWLEDLLVLISASSVVTWPAGAVGSLVSAILDCPWASRCRFTPPDDKQHFSTVPEYMFFSFTADTS